jgi:hypothetical protein
MRELTTNEAIQTMGLYQEDKMRVTAELTKRSLVKLGGVAVDANNVEEIWADLPLADAQLLIACYGKIHNHPKETQDAFFTSETRTATA